MRDVIYLLFHLLTTLAELIKPGGTRAVIAENLLLKQQLIIHGRSRQRAPNLSNQNRALLGFWSLFLNSKRIVRAAIIIKPSTLLSFHNALKNRKYRRMTPLRSNRKAAASLISAVTDEKTLSRPVPATGGSLKLEFAMDRISSQYPIYIAYTSRVRNLHSR